MCRFYTIDLYTSLDRHVLAPADHHIRHHWVDITDLVSTPPVRPHAATCGCTLVYRVFLIRVFDVAPFSRVVIDGVEYSHSEEGGLGGGFDTKTKDLKDVLLFSIRLTT